VSGLVVIELGFIGRIGINNVVQQTDRDAFFCAWGGCGQNRTFSLVYPRLRLRTRGLNAPMVAEIPEGIGPPRPGSGMGGLAEALFVIASEPATRLSAVSNVVKVLKHNGFSF
jgi:hypothetical protein